MGTMETFQRIIVCLFPLLPLLCLCDVADGFVCPPDDIGTEETTYEWKCFEEGRAACYRNFRHCGCDRYGREETGVAKYFKGKQYANTGGWDCISECEGYPYTTGKKVCKKKFSDQCFWSDRERIG